MLVFVGCAPEEIITGVSPITPVSAIVVMRDELLAFEPVPAAITLGSEDVVVDVLLYEEPLATLGLHVTPDGRVPVIPDDTSESTIPLPAPSAWLHRDSGAAELEAQDLTTFAAHLGTMRAQRPPCPVVRALGYVNLETYALVSFVAPIGPGSIAIGVHHMWSEVAGVPPHEDQLRVVALEGHRVLPVPPQISQNLYAPLVGASVEGERALVLALSSSTSATVFDVTSDGALRTYTMPALLARPMGVASATIDGTAHMIVLERDGGLWDLVPDAGEVRSLGRFPRPLISCVRPPAMVLRADGTMVVEVFGLGIYELRLDQRADDARVILDAPTCRAGFAVGDDGREVMISRRDDGTSSVLLRRSPHDEWRVWTTQHPFFGPVALVGTHVFVSIPGEVNLLELSSSPRLCPAPASSADFYHLASLGSLLAATGGVTSFGDPNRVIWLQVDER